jgi:N-acetylmuramoyl-L-alanine amidase
MIQSPSPNFNARAATIALASIIIHYTGMKTADEALARMCDAESKVSAHYMVDENGAVTQMVDEKNRAWHAGASFWRGVTDINSASIGIELVNPGHEFGYRLFPTAQIMALCVLLHDIIKRHSLNPARCLLAHSDIAPSRKQDPGELFPWAYLAQQGLGLWPVTAPQDYERPRPTETTALLSQIGYDITAPDDALKAFQRRFHPENITGVASIETVARLRAYKRLEVRG